ncbi:MAG: adenylate cyclase [Thermodesulfobacteriota bacterium]|nr:adenylate cyclase [Thermodesulfobacteriota bacterium]
MARSYLAAQWAESVQLKLDKAAHQITMKLDEILQLINLIAKAEEAPNGDLIQAYLIQQLSEKTGVRFVDLEVPEANQNEQQSPSIDANDYGSGMVDGLYTMELCGEFGFCAPIMDPGALDRSLRIVKVLGQPEQGPVKRLVVRMSFDSLLVPIREMALWQGSIPLLVTSTGQFLAADDKAFADRKRLGDNGDELEKKLLTEIRSKESGAVGGKGHPPELVIGFFKISAINWYIVLVSKGSSIMEPIIRFRLYSLIGGLAALAIVLLLIRVTTRSVGRSIGAISAAAAKVTDGDYSLVLPEDRSDEIGELNRNFNRMVKGLKQRDLIQDTFGRYVDKAVAEELMSRPEALRLGGEKAVVTIMMSDLRDFTPMSEKLTPEEVIKLLNRYFGRMIAVIERYKGIIVDFYGDSVLVFFNGGDSNVSQRALDAVQCALDMQSELVSFMEENKGRNIPQLSMGIGVHTGEVVVGNIGTETRAKYGIVGAAVNLTDRIQSTASPGKVVISQETYQAISQWLNISHDFKVCLKGIEDHKKLYEVESLSITKQQI